MIVGVLKEILDGENRVAITPQTVKDLLKSNLEVHIQSGAGELSFISDSDYEESGAKIVPDAASILSSSDLVIKVATATLNEVEKLKNWKFKTQTCVENKKLGLRVWRTM